jgi:hypothetical protein
MYNQTAIAGPASERTASVPAIAVSISVLNDRLDALAQAVDAIDQRTRLVRAPRPQEVRSTPDKPSASSPLVGTLEQVSNRVNDAVVRLTGVLQELEL